MNVSFQYANRNNTSVLLKFDGVIKNQTMCLLVDAGDGVDVENLIDAEKNEYLTGILLTHLHRDHYKTLDEDLRDGAKIYTSEENEKILETVLSEANSISDSGIDTADIQSAVEPISTNVTIGGDLTITPVPAGHTPGATAFYIEFDGPDETETILVTGDFTQRKVAGYSGLPLHDTDTLVLTGATSSNFRDSVTSAVDNALQQGVSGSPTLVTASGLNSVHFTYLLGHAIEETSQSLTVNIVGQAAKLYRALNYDVPHVTAIEEYDPIDVVNEGHITVSGPDIPTCGGSKRLFDEIRDDPNAGLIQLVNSDRSEIAENQCTVNRYQAVNHPTVDTIKQTVSLLDPKQIVVTHQTGRDLKRYRDQFSAIVWAPRSNQEHTIYENGECTPPHWVSEEVVSKYRNSGQEVELPTVDGSGLSFARTDANLEEEGLNLDELALITGESEPDSKYSTSAEPEPSPEEANEDPSTTAPTANKELLTDGAVASVEDTGEMEQTPEELAQTLQSIELDIHEIKQQLNAESGVEATAVHVDSNTVVLEVDDGKNLPEVGESVTLR